jgi:Alpha-glutamyl/putrescinyl thymine pyrophosphorylase clade 3
VTQTFCRHNRFIQRCPICRETVPGLESPRPAPKRASTSSRAGAGTRTGGRTGAGTAARAGATSQAGSAARPTGRTYTRRTQEVRVQREARAEDDGYRCELVPGLHASEDARRLVREIGFASGRLLTLTAAPPSLYAEARDCEDIEQATWMCFLAAYLSPLQGEQPFAGVRAALLSTWASGTIPELDETPLGPRSSHDPARGGETLVAYRRFAEHAGSQQAAFTGEASWTPQRRFERVFERLALPGFGRMGRYDLLITLGRLGLYELRADSLHLGTRTSLITSDPAPPAAKRVFGIGDPIHIERRAAALAEALSTPIEALDLALANWTSEERVTLGFPEDTSDAHAVERAAAALEV